MTISGLYRENGNHADFWIQHRNWTDLCGHVLSISGMRAGPLPRSGDADENAAVLLQGHDVSSGRPTPMGSLLHLPNDRNYRRIAIPPWSRTVGELAEKLS